MKLKDISPARRADLDKGRVESATLTEALAVNFAALLGSACPEIGPEARAALHRAAGEGVTRRMALAGALLAEQYGSEALFRLGAHRSDTVRGWVCYALAQREARVEPLLAMLRPFADDAHFGVREWAWLAARPAIAADLEGAIAVLTAWTEDPSHRIRRYASEATRPRGVWCPHLPALKRDPRRGLPLLEPLRADPHRYVQDSVGNWLNDAGKDAAEFVRSLAARWQTASPGPATRYILRRGMRSLPAEP